MRFYLNTNDAWEEMAEECLRAEHSIALEQYILEKDPLGCEFLELLATKARQGVRVRLILDAVGSGALRGSKELQAILDAGGEVVFYRPLWLIQILFPWTWFPRNHCKVLVVDGRVAHVGGICIARYMRGWRDTQISVTGIVADAVQKDFNDFWTHETTGQKIVSSPSQPESALIEYVGHPSGRCRSFPRMLFEEIEKAQDYIYLVTPYFFPPRRLYKALKRARKRGVDVVIMLSQRTDVPFADKVTRALLRIWQHAGFTVLFYRPTILHAKYTVIDGQWGTVGSSNFDYLSLHYNREANIILRDKEHLATLKRHFVQDRTCCSVADMKDWRNQRWWDKLSGLFGAAIYRFL